LDYKELSLIGSLFDPFVKMTDGTGQNAKLLFQKRHGIPTTHGKSLS
jgi:hypothetical protein